MTISRVAAFLVGMWGPWCVRGAELDVRPIRDDAMLLNPGKGWVQYYGPDEKYTRDDIGVGYTRLCWSTLEPKEGQYDWKEIEDFIRYFQAHGKKIAFGVMSVSTGIGKDYVTPKWVFDAGAKSLAIPDATSPAGKQIIPRQWDDPVFLKKLGAFVTALGRRYDGNTNVAFIDIRSYGNWGEGHIGGLGSDPDLKLAPPETLKRRYFQPYLAAFPRTQLIIPWGHDGYNDVYDWAVSQGAGIRRDGILSEWSKDGSECLRAHGRQPGIFEYCSSYADTKKSGYWSTDALLKYVEAGKPSYMQWDRQIFEENREFCLKLGNRIGYHFVLERVTLPSRIRARVPVRIAWSWRNDGVTFLYEPCRVAVALLDANDNVVAKQWLKDSRPELWKPDEVTQEITSVTFPSVPAGKVKLAVGLFLNETDATPAYRLGIQGRTAQGWYVLTDKLEMGP